MPLYVKFLLINNGIRCNLQVMVNRGINKEVIDEGIKSLGVQAFCNKAQCSSSLASLLRHGKYRGGKAPRDEFLTRRIAEAIDRPIDEVFPVIKEG